MKVQEKPRPRSFRKASWKRTTWPEGSNGGVVVAANSDSGASKSKPIPFHGFLKFIPIAASDLRAKFCAESSGGSHATVSSKPRHFSIIRCSGGCALCRLGGIDRCRIMLWYELLRRRVCATTPLRAPDNQDDPECQV